MRYEFCLFFFSLKSAEKNISKYSTHQKEKYLIKHFLFREDEFICQRNPWFIRRFLEYFSGLRLGVLG